MKKAELLLGIIFILSLVVTGCKDDDDDDVCARFDSPTCPALVFTTCSDGTNDYLIYDGDEIPCIEEAGESDVCDNEADNIIEQSGCLNASNLKSAKASYKSFVLGAMNQIRAEAMAAAACN